MLSHRLPVRQSATGSFSDDDPHLLMFSVDQLTTVQFAVRGCSGARLALLAAPWNFTDFVEIAIGTDDNKRTDIRYVMKFLRRKTAVYNETTQV